MNSIVIIDEAKCTGCGACAKMCPRRILYVDQTSKKCRVTDEAKCDRRRGCERVCRANAISVN